MGKMFEQVQIIDMFGLGPVDLDTDRTSDYISVKNYSHGLMVLTTGLGTTGDDWNFTIRQATVLGGGDAKDADIVDEYWIKQAATSLLSTPNFTRSEQTADALISGDATSAEEVSMCVVDLDFARLDVAGGFDFIACKVTLDASGGSQYGLVTLILYGADYPQAIPVPVLS